MENNKKIGENIKNARKKLGFTQDQLTAKLQVEGCDISRGTLAKIEVGLRDIKVTELKTLLKILKIELNDLTD